MVGEVDTNELVSESFLHIYTYYASFSNIPYYMVLSHKDWELPSSRI